MQFLPSFWTLTLAQSPQKLEILLSAEERKVLIGHLDLKDLKGLFLTKRQKLAKREEEFLRTEGYEPFSEKADKLQVRGPRKLALLRKFQQSLEKPLTNSQAFVRLSDNSVGNRETGINDLNGRNTFPVTNLHIGSGFNSAKQGFQPFSTVQPINNIAGIAKRVTLNILF